MLLFPAGTKGIATRDERKHYRAKMRRKPTAAEAEFAARLDSAGIPYKTQQGLGFYIADFFITDRMVVIEIDGGYHDSPEQRRKDQFRDSFIEKCGIPVIRISNDDVPAWDLGILATHKIKPREKYLSLMGRVGRLKSSICREKGWIVTKKQARLTRLALGLAPDAHVTWEQVQEHCPAKPKIFHLRPKKTKEEKRRARAERMLRRQARAGDERARWVLSRRGIKI